eukprot:TRINITY_DN2918_c0_g1_i2.p1 TRINITY_DN2918_c0_g1~~TRINITY_DN2918_c0_g1_i2.p1  ORF type:complete len:892 (+),score=354.34 TRINITY_DN2918_c0_g1_i2:79-2754(+)
MTSPDQGADISLVKVYELEGGEQALARFEDQHGVEELRVGGDTINVHDTHAETMWFATAQVAPPDTYPTATGEGGKPVLCRCALSLVPPNPRPHHVVAGHQGPVYRILEEEVIGDEPQGYISTGQLSAVDYLENLDEDVTSQKPRVSGTAPRHGGVLFKKFGVGGGSVVDQCLQANAKTLHVMNEKGVAQSVATRYSKKSKRGENLRKWAEADMRGDFSEWSYRFEFDHDGGWHVSGYEEMAIDTAESLGLSFEADGVTVAKVKGGSPAATVGITDDIPWRHVAPREGPDYYRELNSRMRFVKLRSTNDPNATEAGYQETDFSVSALNGLLAQRSAATIVLVRAPLARSDSVRRAIDDVALSERTAAVRKLQERADSERWYVRCEDLAEAAFPPAGDKPTERAGMGPFPADWPGYHMVDENGHKIQWDPERHAEPLDADFHAREFVKQYCYVLARGSMKGPSGPSGDKWMGLSALYAALYGYESGQGKKADELDDMFPDRNADTRKAYTAGVTSQIPREWTAAHHGGDSEKAFKALLLRYAYFIGFNNPGRKAEELVPSTDRLRQAYKDGKRAVCVGITQATWDSELGKGSHKKDTYKSLAVPVEFVNMGRAGVDDQDARAATNFMLRTVWEQGVDDAWEGRQKDELTGWVANTRVPDTEEGASCRDACRRGADAAKRSDEYLAGLDGLRMNGADSSREPLADKLARAGGVVEGLGQSGLQVQTGGGFEDRVDPSLGYEEFQRKAKLLAFKDGLALQWEANTGGKDAPKPDDRYPYTTDDLRRAFEDGATCRARDEKKKQVVDKVEEAPPEETCCESCCQIACWPCIQLADVCCPLTTEDPATGKTLCCGTTYMDWALILCCFFFYYTFLSMWYWALIEVMLAVAEPQRPW